MSSRMTKQELVGLVSKLMNADYASEEERNILIDLLENNVLHPEVTDLIFYPDKEMTPEEVVELALVYRPIILPTRLDDNDENTST